MDLSILIPARNEIFLAQTIDNIFQNARAETEVIAVCDGYLPDPPIPERPRLRILHYEKSIGQRAATNAAARLSDAKYIMKLDAHCSFDEGFDVKLMDDIKPDWTVVPAMYNLHAFDWLCKKCGYRRYQGPTPKKCDKCDNTTDFEREMVWEIRPGRRTEYWRFTKEMRFKYWTKFRNRPEAQAEIVDILCQIGACWMMSRDRYWELDGLDEAHGSWGQMGVEISCKSWLSGGRQVVNKKTWFGHLFRTSAGFNWPYPIAMADVEKARAYSRDLWLNDKWPKAKRPLSWLVEKFAPVPSWHVKEKPAAEHRAFRLRG